MKKGFIIAHFLLFVPILGMSQLMLGPKIGVNMATQFQSEYTVPKFDLAYGAALMAHITDAVSVQGEFLVSRKGYREEYNGREVFDELTATYLEIPVMLKYNNMGVNWGYFGQAGVYWAYWNKAEYQSSVDGQNIISEIYQINSEFDQDGYRDIRSDFGFVVEGGVTYDNLGSGIMALGIRYSHGLTATGEYQEPPSDFVEKKNQVITISLTYFLYL